jgi:hypothetical protein
MKFNYYVWVWRQVITHIWECCEDRNQYKPCKAKHDNTTYALSPWPYVRQPFAKSLRAQNRSSTLGMKSWFHGVHRPGRHPGLPHSPSNNHHRVAVTEATRFMRPHKSRISQYTIDTFSSWPNTTRSLIDTGGGYHLRSSESDIWPLSTFPSIILHFFLVALPSLKLR